MARITFQKGLEILFAAVAIDSGPSPRSLFVVKCGILKEKESLDIASFFQVQSSRDDKDIYLYDPLLLNVYKSDFFSTFFIRMNKVLHFNSIQIQRSDSVMCGYHALVFCFVMKNGGSEQKFRSFLESFASYNVSNREQLSLTYFTIIRKYDSKSDVKS